MPTTSAASTLPSHASQDSCTCQVWQGHQGFNQWRQEEEEGQEERILWYLHLQGTHFDLIEDANTFYQWTENGDWGSKVFQTTPYLTYHFTTPFNVAVLNRW